MTMLINHLQYTDDAMNFYFPPSPPYFADHQEHEHQIEIGCGDCGHDGGWFVVTGYDHRDGGELGYWEECPTCGGRGGGWIDTEPLTLDDLDLINEEINSVGG